MCFRDYAQLQSSTATSSTTTPVYRCCNVRRDLVILGTCVEPDWANVSVFGAPGGSIVLSRNTRGAKGKQHRFLRSTGLTLCGTSLHHP